VNYVTWKEGSLHLVIHKEFNFLKKVMVEEKGKMLARAYPSK
jgi:hypothetical protein